MNLDHDHFRIGRRDLLKGFAALWLAAYTLDFDKAYSAMSPKRGSLIDYVNVMQGTKSNFGYSAGSTLPLVSRPYGMTHWSPQNDVQDGWYFNPDQHKIQGIRATHEPSPWMGDYGRITIMGQRGEAVYDTEKRACVYDENRFDVHPHSLVIDLYDQGVKIEVAPTERCAIFRFTFAPGAPARVLIDAPSAVSINSLLRVVNGYSNLNHGGARKNFACYFHAEFDQPFSSAFPLRESVPVQGQSALDGENIGASIEFSGGQVVTMRIGTSFISSEQAAVNLTREVGNRDFDALRDDADKAWNDALGVVRIEGGSEEGRRTFYSCLYRSFLFPRPIHEYDNDNRLVHYSPYDGKIHDGPLYADTGLWDGYHTVYALMSLLNPDRLSELVEGFLNAYRECGWLPQWPSPGSRGSMGATHSDALITDAILKNIGGFDRETAYQAIRKDGMVPSTDLLLGGRSHLEFYLEHGYRAHSVSDTLDYAYDDACIALAAKGLGHDDDYRLFSKRALNYQNVYDPSVGFMRAKKEDGSWVDFDQYAWGGAYTEGGAWQWTWSAPHDPAGLIDLMGGQAEFLAKLDRMFLQPPVFHTGAYGAVIHEMKEMAAANFGQYDQGNQPAHQVLPLFTAAGCPWKTQYWMRRALDKLYTPDSFPGDEDNGEMASWYVLASIGLFPNFPGHPSFMFTSPQFERTRIRLKNGKTLMIDAVGNGPHNVYANKIVFNGHLQEKTWIGYDELMHGGDLRYSMSDRPINPNLKPSDLPFSISPYGNMSSGLEIAATRIDINCGGDGAGDFVGDCFVSGGDSKPLPQSEKIMQDPTLPVGVLACFREGDFRYDIPLPMLPGGKAYRVSVWEQSGTMLNINGAASAGKLVSGTGGERRIFDGVLPVVDGCIEIGAGSADGRIYAISVESVLE